MGLANTNEQYNQNIIINSNPNSFFYRSAQHSGDLSMNFVDAIDNCETFYSDNSNTDWDIACNSDNFPNNSDICEKNAYCRNINEVKELNNNRDIYGASGQLYNDSSENYKKHMIKSINLTVGSAFLVYVIINKILK